MATRLVSLPLRAARVKLTLCAEVLPAAYRATGMGLAVSINRIGGIIATLLFVYAQARPDSPLWASGALFLLSAVVALLMPFEPTARRPV
jgi:membrane protein YdbS with pleckstrin-like domain